MPQPLADTNLFKPIQVGKVSLAHRLVHAPTTRWRNSEEFVPTDSMLTYYTQRAENNGGLLIVEATFPSMEFGLLPATPVFKTEAQVQGWKKIVESVHKKGTSISLQLWGLGNASDPVTLKKYGLPLIGASEVYYDEATKNKAEAAGNPLHALTVDEIHSLIREYGAAAKRAVNVAGFDFVEVHCAHMNISDQFLNASVNHRTDEYGGSIENRARFVLEAIDSVVEAVGAERTAVRLSPYAMFNGGEGVNAKIHPVVTYGYVLSELERRAKEGKRIAYVSIVEPRVSGDVDMAAPPDVNSQWINEIWKGVILRSGALLSEAEYPQLRKYVDGDNRTLIGASRFFTSNPDLPERLRKGLPLTHYDRSRFYTHENAGYITWGRYGEGSHELSSTKPKPLQ